MFSELKKYEQYQDIPYVKDFHCPCGESGFYNLFKVIQKPNIVGWCDTHIGYMIVFECIWETKINSTLNADRPTESTERLFVAKGQDYFKPTLF